MMTQKLSEWTEVWACCLKFHQFQSQLRHMSVYVHSGEFSLCSSLNDKLQGFYSMNDININSDRYLILLKRRLRSFRRSTKKEVVFEFGFLG